MANKVLGYEVVLWILFALFTGSSFYIAGPITLTKIGFLLLILILGVRLLSGASLPLPKLFNAEIYLILFFILSGISVFWSKDISVAFSHYISLATAIILYFLVRLIVRRNGDRSRVLICALIYVAIIGGLLGVLQFLTGSLYVPGIEERSIRVGDTFRGNGLFDDPNYLGYLLVIIWPLVFIQSNKIGLVRIFFVLVLVLGIISTFSRASLLTFLIQLIVLFLIKSNKLTKSFFLTLLTLPVAFLILYFNPFGVLDRFLSFLPVFFNSGGEVENSTAERYDLLFAGARMFYDNIFFGVGFGNFQLYSTEYMTFFPREVYAHNTYLTIASEGGVLIFCFYLAFISSGMSSLRKYGNPFIIVSFVGFLLSNFFLVAHYFPVAYLYLAAIFNHISSSPHEKTANN